MLYSNTELIWSKANRKYYREKGYIFTEYGNFFVVNVSDLTKGSHVKVKVKCDYCGKDYCLTYKDYNKGINTSVYGKLSCCDCDALKKEENYTYKNMIGKLNVGEKGYYTIKENREKELINFIQKNGSIDNLQSKNKSLYTSISMYDKMSPINLALKLGYERNLISKYTDDYYENIDNLTSDIGVIIKELGYFPRLKEILDTLQISNEKLLFHGGIEAIKTFMGYNSKEHLKDNNGFFNKSRYEYIVAEFLIKNTNLKYNRETKPFNDSKIRCDFEFTYEENFYYVEVWGVPKNDSSGSYSRNYNAKRKEKEIKYREKGLNLISLDCEFLLARKDNTAIDAYLREKFSQFLIKQ